MNVEVVDQCHGNFPSSSGSSFPSSSRSAAGSGVAGAKLKPWGHSRCSHSQRRARNAATCRGLAFLVAHLGELPLGLSGRAARAGKDSGAQPDVPVRKAFRLPGQPVSLQLPRQGLKQLLHVAEVRRLIELLVELVYGRLSRELSVSGGEAEPASRVTAELLSRECVRVGETRSLWGLRSACGRDQAVFTEHAPG